MVGLCLTCVNVTVGHWVMRAIDYKINCSRTAWFSTILKKQAFLAIFCRAALFVFEFSDFEMFFIELDVCVPELNISVSNALAS
jgi:hypothetical protein